MVYTVDAARLANELIATFEHPDGPRGRLIDGERAKGAAICRSGQVEPFAIPESDWIAPVISRLDDDVRIVAVWARSQRRGAFHRLVASIKEAGLRPVVIDPIGPTMPAIMKRWGWKGERVGEGWESYEEWRDPTDTQPPGGRHDGDGPWRKYSRS